MGGLNFENLYILEYWSKVLYVFGLLDKCCIFKSFVFLTAFLGFSFIHHAPGTSVITVPHYHHIGLNFCQMNGVFGGHFLGFCFSKSIFLGFLSAVKYFSG